MVQVRRLPGRTLRARTVQGGEDACSRERSLSSLKLFFKGGMS